MKTNSFSLIITFVFFSFFAKAQDPEFTQIMATPSYFNPAFAGMQQNLRACLQFRDQWPGTSGSFITVAGSADMGLPKINSGVGLMLMHDQAGDADLSTNTVNAYYAYEIKLPGGCGLRFGLNPSLFQRSINLSQLRFGSQIDPKLGFINQTPNNLPSTSTTPLRFDLSGGTLFYSANFYGGLAVYHIFQPNESFFDDGVAVLPIKYTIQAGYFISLGGITINPYFLVMSQGTFTQVLPGVNVTYGMFTIGSSFRQTDPNADAVNFLLGFAKGIFKVCYSYDLTVSEAKAAAAGSHELSLVVQLNKPHDTSTEPMIGHLRKSY